jgi:hypothetical protein
VIDVAYFVGRERNLTGDIVWDVHLAVTWIQFHSVLRRPVEHRNQICFDMSDSGVLQMLVGQEWNEVIPEDAADHCRHNGAAKLLLNVSKFIHKHPIVLLNLWM